MNSLKGCKSGFARISQTRFEIMVPTSSKSLDSEVVQGISSLALSPPNYKDGKFYTSGYDVVLKIEIPFLEAYKILSRIIRYAHTIPTLTFVSFKEIKRSDLGILCAVVLKQHLSVPFDIYEFIYYPKTHCFEMSIIIDEPIEHDKYRIRNRWAEVLQKLLKTDKVNVLFIAPKEH